jgi:hypothetical protein
MTVARRSLRGERSAVPENVERWWERRQKSKGVAVPYEVGTYRKDWERYPILIRQYHPELNRGITLTQVPPAADVYLVWECDVGHHFVATPEEQRSRPSGQRRRSSWCPDCAALAVPKRVRPRRESPPTSRPKPRKLREAPRKAVSEAFFSEHAPRPASAAEAQLRQWLHEVLEFDSTPNAVRVARPFFGRFEVWPDIPIAELAVAIEYDTTGRFGLEHVGTHEDADRRKDRALRAAGWEVIRVRCGKLQPIGDYDLIASGVTRKLVARLLDRLREIRGDLIVDCYLREPPGQSAAG